MLAAVLFSGSFVFFWIFGAAEPLVWKIRISDSTGLQALTAENDDNARAVRDQEKKGVRIDRLLKRIERLDEEHAALEEQIQQRAAADAETWIFIKTLKAIEGTVTEFDDVLWTVLLDSITVYSPEDIRVRFKGGREVVVGMRSKQKEKQTG